MRHSSRRKKGVKGARTTRRKSRITPLLRGGGDDPKAVVFVLGNNAGFFSTYFTLCKAYLYAKEKGAEFYIDHDAWQYTYEKGWHDYFTTLQLFPKDKAFSVVERFKHIEVDRLPTYSVGQYQQAIRETFVLRPDLEAKVEKVKAAIGGLYTSLYVRRGDKVFGPGKEMDMLDIPTIISKTDIKDDSRKLFIQTDDHRVVEEVAKLVPSCKLFTTTPSGQHGSSADVLRSTSPSQAKAHAEELFISTRVLLGGMPIWTDIRSNVGRFHMLSEFGKVKVYPDENAIKDLTLSSIVKPHHSLP